MPKKLGNVARDILVKASLPKATSTYTVISHSFVIDAVSDALEENEFEIENEEYKCTAGAQVAQGIFTVNYGEDPDLKMVYGFSNSYDKSLRFRCAIGACSTENGAYMIRELDNWKRKHTGTADDETQELITKHIGDAQKYYDKLKADKDAMKNIDITKNEYGALLGKLYINEFLSLDQFSYAMKEMAEPSFTYSTPANNLWTCYNHILLALKLSHPTKWLQNQVGVHTFLLTEFDLIQFDEEEEEVQEIDDDLIEITTNVETDEEYEARVASIEGEPEVEEEVANDLPDVEGGHQFIPAGSTVGIEVKTTSLSEVLDAPEEERTFDNTTIDNVEELEKEVPATIEDIEGREKSIQGYPADWDDTEEIELIEEEAEESQYISTDDYEGIGVGDTLEIGDGDYFTVVAQVEMEGENYYEIKPLVMDESEIEEAVVVDSSEPEETIELPSAIVEVEEPIEEVVVDFEDPLAEEETETAPVAEGEDPFEEEEIIEEAVEEEKVVLSGLELKISQEIKSVYGKESKFTYAQEDDDISVVLETGESLVLSKDYLEMVY